MDAIGGSKIQNKLFETSYLAIFSSLLNPNHLYIGCLCHTTFLYLVMESYRDVVKDRQHYTDDLFLELHNPFVNKFKHDFVTNKGNNVGHVQEYKERQLR